MGRGMCITSNPHYLRADEGGILKSAGAYSIGNHLLAYGGRDDGLFRAGIYIYGTSISLTAASF